MDLRQEMGHHGSYEGAIMCKEKSFNNKILCVHVIWESAPRAAGNQKAN